MFSLNCDSACKFFPVTQHSRPLDTSANIVFAANVRVLGLHVRDQKTKWPARTPTILEATASDALALLLCSDASPSQSGPHLNKYCGHLGTRVHVYECHQIAFTCVGYSLPTIILKRCAGRSRNDSAPFAEFGLFMCMNTAARSLTHSNIWDPVKNNEGLNKPQRSRRLVDEPFEGNAK